VKKAMDSVCSALVKTHSLGPVGLAENVYDLLRRFRCRALGDTIARVAGDPIRKLSGPHGRLIGAARLCLSCGTVPEGIIHSIALALRYDNPLDESAVQLQEMIAAKGLTSVLKDICGLGPDEQLYSLILGEHKKISTNGSKSGGES